MALKVALIRYRYDPFGGAERFTDALVKSLAARGIEVHLFARKWGGNLPPGVELHRIGGPSWPRMLGHASFVALTGRAVRKEAFDLIQSNEHTLCQHIYRAGDGVHARWLELRGKRQGRLRRLSVAINPFHRYRLWLERRLFEHPELRAVVVNSEMVRNEVLERFRIPAARLHTIYNGVDLERFHPGNRAVVGEALRRRNGLDAGKPLVLFVGSGFERKGLSFLMLGMARAGGEAQLWVVGKNRTRPYEKLAETLGIGSRVRFFGPQADTVPFYAAADVFALPTLYDPFPSVVLEAMASGVPVITTKQCGAAEILTQGENGFVLDTPDDLVHLTEALHSLYDPGFRHPLSLKARERAEQFPMERTVRELELLYHRLLQLERDAGTGAEERPS